MNFPSTLILIGLSALLGRIIWDRWRALALLGTSVLAVFAFQPALPIRGLDFWLPSLTLGLTTLCWVLTTPAPQRRWREQLPAIALLTVLPLLLGLTRYLDIPIPVTASLPPQWIQIAIFALSLASIAILLARLHLSNAALTIAFIFILLLFAVLKIPALAHETSTLLRQINQQSTTLASPLDLRWLGFSYIAFRLLHTVRDRQNGRLPDVSLPEYIIYVIFFPALSAGPIDRIERFITDLRRSPALTGTSLGLAGQRLVIGLFKKFVLADSLSLLALNSENATQVHTAGWAWVMLYAYAFQIYFDFSGYTDIAIGMGKLMGFNLPENFSAPYLKPNLTQFWNSWHITLTQWFRSYFFNPLTRWLRSSRYAWPPALLILVTQLATMLLIGFWHGVTWPFVLWGLWHGLGLFVDNRWSTLTRTHIAALSPHWQAVFNVCGVIVTFHFVALGWVFFALPSLDICFHFLRILFSQSPNH